MTEPTKTETTAATPDTIATTTTLKPGWKTTEYWITKVVAVIGALMAAGYIADGTQAARICGAVMVSAAALGYSVSRGLAKGGAAGVLLVVLALGATQPACNTLKDTGKRVAGDVVDCMKPDAKAAIGELAPAFRDIVKNATGDNGRVDWAPVRAVAAPLKSAATRCAFTAVIAEVLRPHPKAGAPQSSALQADATDVLAGYRAIQAEYFGGATFKLPDGDL